MPGPRRALFACMAPSAASAGRELGRGITAELVPNEDGDGLSLAVATPSSKRSEAFVSTLNRQLSQLGREPEQARPSRGPAKDTGTIEDEPTEMGKFKLESSAYYYFSKLLLDQRQEPGLAATQFVQSFVETYRALSPTAVEQGRPMGECVQAVERLCRIVEEVLDNMSCPPVANATDPPMALAEINRLRPWLRHSVERCIFTRVGGQLWHLYEGRHSAEDAQYAQKARALAVVSDARLLDELSVRYEFRGSAGACSLTTCIAECDTEDVTSGGSMASPDAAATSSSCARATEDSGSGSQLTRSTAATAGTAGADEAAEIADAAAPTAGTARAPSQYERASAALSQMEVAFHSVRSFTPRDAVEALLASQLEMKTCALEASAGQEELCSMDDIMPIFVFVLLRSSLGHPFACARFAGDALSQDDRMDTEGRAVVLLESAARHVAYDWDISNLLSCEEGAPV